MRIRPYIENKDYRYLEKWIDDEKVHAMWCANLIPYPMTQENLRSILERMQSEWTDCAYVATEDGGTPVGFFCYSIDTKSSIGFLKFIIVDTEKRGKGYGKQMLRLALRYAFNITGAEAVQLNVFEENTAAKHCYERLGFVEKTISKNVFPYQDELWSRCNMITRKEGNSRLEDQ